MEMREICCPVCFCIYAMPELAAQKYEQNHKTFFCPQGHSQNYPQLTNYEILEKEIKDKDLNISVLHKVIRHLRGKKTIPKKGGVKK